MMTTWWRNVWVPVICVVCELPTLVMGFAFLIEADYEQSTLIGQVLDTTLWLTAAAHVVLFVVTVGALVVHRRAWTSVWWLVAAGAVLAGTVGVALLLTAGRVREHSDLIVLACIGSALAVVVLLGLWPKYRRWPVPTFRGVGASAIAGVVSLAGIQAWNTLQFTPSQLEASITTASEFSAVKSTDGTRLTGTVTVENVGDVPALIVASQYVVWAVDVTDVKDWPLGQTGDPLEPAEYDDNGASTRDVIGTGTPFRPYQRVSAKSKARFQLSMLTARPESAFRLSVRVFSARADRLFLEQPDQLTPGPVTFQNERGSQLANTIREGSRLRAFTHTAVVAVASWWHTPDASDPVAREPAVSVFFYAKRDKPATAPIINNKEVRQYGVARQFYETTVFSTTKPTPDAASASTAGG